MSRQIYAVCLKCFFSLVVLLSIAVPVLAQSTAAINGLVQDTSSALIPNASVKLINTATGTESNSTTNKGGSFVLPGVMPGHYTLQIEREGFDTTQLTGITLNVGDNKSVVIRMKVGSKNETVTVDGSGLTMNTTDGSVSTVVDRQFAENLPMNGRSFQTLIELTPGVVLTPSYEGSEGQFSVNGQRSTSNNWMVDGVSANIGIGANFNGGNGVAGSVGSFSVLGGTNSLVSVDALQEFRIQTSTYAPEFGRTPGGQISIVTRSGTNEFHGTVFDYLRNSDLDANNWFGDEAHLNKPAERQNDFGGTFSGPLFKNHTFFFFSYEGLRLRVPETALTTVPDMTARLNAVPAVQTFLNAYPLPNGPDNTATEVAQANASYSNPATLDAFSLRLDHTLSKTLAIFARYNYSPSKANDRAASTLYPLSDLLEASIRTQTATAGLTWTATPFVVNEFRFNYSNSRASSFYTLDNYGGAVPPTAIPLPAPYSTKNALFDFSVFGLSNGYLTAGKSATNTQNQINLIDSLSMEKGSHNLKFGVDYRRLTPSFDPALYSQEPIFGSVASAAADNLLAAVVTSAQSSTLLLQNLGVFVQDTWRVVPRLTLTYGVRWDLDFAPKSINGPSLPAVTGYDLSNLSNLALAPAGTPPFTNTYGNLAPRLGFAYQLSEDPDWGRVLRGGFGLFYDLATSQVGDALGSSYPFGATTYVYGPTYGGSATFPLSPADAAPIPVNPAQLTSIGATLTALDPHLKLPYTFEWNVAIQQQLGKEQNVAISYIGSAGQRLIQSAYISSPNQNIYSADLIGNTASSDYNALQIQFQRRLSHGLQTLASYTWSHSIDDGSTGAYGIGSNAFVPNARSNQNRGSSDFDTRHAFSTALTYDIPAPQMNRLANAMLRKWSLDDIIQAFSAPPVNVYYSDLGSLSGAYTEVRPDISSGNPFYLYGSQYPGRKAFDPAAFISPPTDSNGNPLRQGNLGRNALRGFGGVQWDCAIHRDIPIYASLKLQFRAELFNVLNHPNFGPPIGNLEIPQSINPQFGVSTQTLAQYLGNTNIGGGGFSNLYQIGGPRSVQLALKLAF